MENNCVFCNRTDYIFETEDLIAFHDHFPVNNGHILITPKRHIESIFDFTVFEWNQLQKMLRLVEGYLSGWRFEAEGFNIGFNDGRVAGQTIFHAHIHVIPRYEGDVADPRGGIRNIKEALVKY